MGRYLLLLRDGEEDRASTIPESDWQALIARFVTWSDDLRQRGILHGAERLSERRGKTLRKRGSTLAIDGPYAEGKEAVVGLFVIEADSHDAAVDIARGVPSLDIGGTVEVREVREFPSPDDS